jgi:hypothetical protein
VPENVSASAAVADPSVQAAVVPRSPMQPKSSKKKKTKGDNIVTVLSPASATTSTRTALLPLVPKSLSAEKKRQQIQCLAKALKAASPHRPPVVVASKEAGPALAPMVSTALKTLPERNTSSASGISSPRSLSDDDSLSSSSQPAMATGGSIIDSGTAIVSAAEVIAAVSVATSTAALSSTNPSIEAVMEPSFSVFAQVFFFILILISDLKCTL